MGEVRQIWMLQTGGDSSDAKPIRDLKELCERAVQFPVTVDKAPIPMEARYQDYTEILRTGLLKPHSREANELVIRFGTNQRMFKYLGQGMSRLTQYKRDLDKAVDEDLLDGEVDPETIAKAYSFHEYTEERMISFFRNCYLDYLNCDVAKFVKELRDAVIRVSSEFNVRPSEKKEMVLESKVDCKKPVSVAEAANHLTLLEKLATPGGFWGLGGTCFQIAPVKEKPGQQPRDPSGSIAARCAKQHGHTVLRLKSAGSSGAGLQSASIKVSCQKRVRNCQTLCWL